MEYTPIDFARVFLGEHKVKGNEIIPVYCPVCKGGSKRDKYTFALNIDSQTYNCKRGTCGAKGHFSQLCKDYGVNMEKQSEYIPAKKIYKNPQRQPQNIYNAAAAYIKLRGISEETVKAYKVGSDENGNIMFPYYNDRMEHVFNKFRPARKIVKGERKMWRESDTMPILYGMWKCDYDKPLVICEGEFDAMACHEAGVPNAVSVPSGAEDFTWVDTCWDFIQRFDAIYIFGDNDAPGIEMIKRLSVKLSEKRIYIVEHEQKDANELLHIKGAAAVKSAYESAKEVPVSGLINLASVLPLDITKMESINTSIAPLNKNLGGFLYGDVTVWTGKRGEGKSTLLSQIMIDAVNDGKNVCAYSGELRADRFQYWTDLQAAGRQHIQEHTDSKTGKVKHYIEPKIRQKIHDWYNCRYWLYDNAIAIQEEEVTILKVFEIAAKRYDCRVFLVDNLMTADYGRMTDNDFYRQQSRFVGQLVSFANRHNCHVHLVAHPRKESGKLSSDSVSGSGDITNRVANVISVERTVRGKDGCDVIIDIKKNRWEGDMGNIHLNYCKISRRMYTPETGDTVNYGWDKDNGVIEITSEYGELPF